LKPALIVRNILQRINPIEGARQHVNRMAEFEAHNLALKGDVLVIQGVADVSNMGGISAQTGKRQGEIGAIVQGGVRDARALDYPVWASDITPVTGKWRIETMEINGPVQIGEVRVAAGDLVVADNTGVCFIPRDVPSLLNHIGIANERISSRTTSPSSLSESRSKDPRPSSICRKRGAKAIVDAKLNLADALADTNVGRP
jgi:hypothetical protein